jgi:hypothetical protein
MAQAHRRAIELLADAVRTTSKTTATEMRALKRRIKADQGPEDTKAKLTLRELVLKFGSVAEGITVALDGGDAAAYDIQELRDGMNGFYQKLNDYSTAAQLESKTILKVVAKMRDMANSRNAGLKSRFSRLEAAMARPNAQPSSPPTPPRPTNTYQAFKGAPGIDGNTPLGVATVGGSEVIISANYLFGMVRELQAKVDVLVERSKNTGVIFGQLAFASESEFLLWMVAQNPSGLGMAGFVDLISIWAFAVGDSVDKSTWLNEAHRAKLVGLKGGNADAMYAHSMTRRYPTSFTRKEKNQILSTTTIMMLETYEAWRGTIMGDGQKERLTTDLQLAANRHRQYCLDFLPEGMLRDTALKTAEYTLQFWNALAAYIKDEYTLLLSFKLLPKHVLLLLSNQVVQICNDMFELRNCANNVDLQNPLATTT